MKRIATTRRELVTLRAAELLADALAKSNGGDCSDVLLTVAVLQAEDEVGPSLPRPEIAMIPPKILVNGHPWPPGSATPDRSDL